MTNIGAAGSPLGSPNSKPTAPPTPLAARPPSTRAAQGFRAGDQVTARYRIVSPLGKGGMGEVFRADDLELGVSVALKFLPVEVSADPLRLEHFRTEVRLARQIAHPSVCRVYDIAQVETPVGPRHFLSMEFIDGEDLSSLLRRIGRLPQDKAVEIARQICFGLAAAHEHGVIHRDLKPANVMIDGRGRARITDFGVAGLADELKSRGDITSGTPDYMAPEQLEGVDVTRRSDIYSLGLVLFEIFTGKPAFKASSLADLRAHRRGDKPVSRPSLLVPDLDPAVERVILRCLEVDSANRPTSAIAVAAALPGGDPLAAALAAGETPSPELVAASGGTAVITPRAALACAACILLAALALVFGMRSISLFAQARPAKSVEVLTDRAQDILRQLGHDRPHQPGVARLTLRPRNRNSDKSLAIPPGPFAFWYRHAPTDYRPALPPLVVSDSDPFPAQIGEAVVRTDDRGMLERLIVIPPSRPDPLEIAADPEAILDKLFALAGRSRTDFAPADISRRPYFQTDVLRAWTAPDPDRPDRSITIHAGITDSRPTFFEVRYAFTPEPGGWAAGSRIDPREISDYAAPAILTVIVVSMSVLAWRNLRAGRGDRRAAAIGSIAVALLDVVEALCSSNISPRVDQLFYSGHGYAGSIWVGALFWVFYIALEPAARRLFPHTLITWSRLLRGRISDALIARDVLTGVTAGICVHATLAMILMGILATRQDPPAPSPIMNTSAYLLGFSGIAATIAGYGVASLMTAAGSLLLLVVGRLVFRSTTGGIVVCILGLAALMLSELAGNPVDLGLEVISHAVLVALMLTRGLLAAATYWFVLLISGLLTVGPDWTGLGAAAYLPALTIVALLAWSLRSGMRTAPAPA